METHSIAPPVCFRNLICKFKIRSLGLASSISHVVSLYFSGGNAIMNISRRIVVLAGMFSYLVEVVRNVRVSFEVVAVSL